jgi:adenylylsulfate kinase
MKLPPGSCNSMLAAGALAVWYYRGIVFTETKKRSIIKSVTFRILVVLMDLLIIYALTKRADTTIVLTVLTNATSTMLYFLHERAWNNLGWGKKRLQRR